MTRCDPAPALRLHLGHVSQALPDRLALSKQSLVSVAYALHILRGLLPCHLSLEYILMGPSAAVRPPPRGPGQAPRGAERSWSRGGMTGRRDPGAIGWVSPTTAPSCTSNGGTGPSPCSRGITRRPARYWPQSPVCMQCGMRCCLPRGRPRCPRSNITPARGRTPPREPNRNPNPNPNPNLVSSPRAHAGVPTPPHGARHLSRTLTHVYGPRVGIRGSLDASPSPPAGPPPRPKGASRRVRVPPSPPPYPAHGTATGLPPLARGGGRRMHYMHGWPICAVVGTAMECPLVGL